MKVAIVKLSQQFGVKCLKKRPCLIIEQSKKHAKVCMYTHKPMGGENNVGIVYARRHRHNNSWLDLGEVFIIRNEYIAYTCETINPIFAQEIKKELNKLKGKQIIHCINYKN